MRLLGRGQRGPAHTQDGRSELWHGRSIVSATGDAVLVGESESDVSRGSPRRLHVVAGAPEFSMPAYVVYPLDRQGDHVSSAIEIMHRLADAQTRQTADVPAVKRSARKRR